jgi:transcription antitermination factor NusG
VNSLGAKICRLILNWGQESVGSSRECSLTRRTGRNSISIGWASEVSFLGCGAPFDTRTGCRTPLQPLFPSYIFIVMDLSKHRWRSVNGTFGVASLVMGAQRPLPVPRGVVEALVASCESCGAVRFDDSLEIGQKVRILSGPFAETLCRLAHLDDRGRVRVLIEIIGMEVAAQLDRSAIAPAA